jgi:hypothetical protein
VGPLQIYEKVTPAGTAAQRTIKAARYAGDHYELGPVLQTIYYRLKDPAEQPPFTKEMLTVQTLTLHFYNENGKEIRKEDYLPAPKANVSTAAETEAVNYGHDRAKRIRDLFHSFIKGEEVAEADIARGLERIPRFDWPDIPILLELAESTRLMREHIPALAISSYRGRACIEGMVALWLIEGLRQKQAELLRQMQTGEKPRTGSHYQLPGNPICRKEGMDWEACEKSPRIHHEALLAHRQWWHMVESLPPQQAAAFDPLGLADITFGNDKGRLEIYERPSSNGTAATRTVEDDGYVLKTVHYSLRDPSELPPFTKEMLTVQKLVLHFYNKNGKGIRTESVHPASRQP